jgi:DNA topoisomerase-3
MTRTDSSFAVVAEPPKRRKKGEREPRNGKKRERRREASQARNGSHDDAPLDPRAAAIDEALRAWRLGEARRRGIPAFRILTDRVLNAIATARPGDEGGLLEVPGIGPRITREYGEEILSIVSRTARG